MDKLPVTLTGALVGLEPLESQHREELWGAAIRRRSDEAAAGSSRFMAVRWPDRVVEIGWT
jgi:hypothetical protein